MLVSYAAYMSDKLQAEGRAYGPRRPKRTAGRHEMKFRVELRAFEKLQALAKVEELLFRMEDPAAASSISDNAQLQHILDEFIMEYEKAHGPLPSPGDEEAIAKHAQKRAR